LKASNIGFPFQGKPTSDSLDKLNNEFINWTNKKKCVSQQMQSLLLQHRSRERSPTDAYLGQLSKKTPRSLNEEGRYFFQLDLGRTKNSVFFLDIA